MSRWIEQFENSQFTQKWLPFAEKVEAVKLESNTTASVLSEFERARKTVIYLNEIINSVDSELMPLGFWNDRNLIQYISNSTSYLNQFEANNDNLSTLQNLNNQLDAIIKLLSPYFIVQGKHARALKKSITEYSKSISEYTNTILAEISGLKEEANSHVLSINNSVEKIGKYELELLGDEENVGIKDEVEDFLIDIKSKKEKIDLLHWEIYEGDEANVPIKRKITEATALIDAESQTITEIVKSSSKETRELKNYHKEVFGFESKEGEITSGKKLTFESLLDEMVKFEYAQKEKYIALNNEIESLLPGATSAGLATAYKELKDGCKVPIKNATNGYYVSIGLLVLVALFISVESIGFKTGISFHVFSDWHSLLKAMVMKLPFYGPILWFAAHMSKRRSQFQRLQQEYAHKEAVAKSYNSYKKQILELGEEDNELQKRLISKAIDAIAFNASKTLDGKHGDKMPVHDVLEQVTKIAESK